VTWTRQMTPFPAVRIWFVRSKVIYWQTRTDERDYGDGMVGNHWFSKQHPQIERPIE
jgi:hypothetical protein